MGKYTKFLWCSSRTISPASLVSLYTRFSCKPIEILYFPLPRQQEPAQSFQVILAEARRVETQILGGDFDPVLTGLLVKSLSIGGAYSGYTIVLPAQSHKHWEVFS